jgi:hypothetical protein
LRIKPEDSYFFDGLTVDQAEDWLNNVTFYNDLTYNIPLGRFLSERALAEAFVPIATFDNERRDREQEFVAMVEGAHFPFYFTAFSPDKHQFNHHLSIEEDIDHGKPAVRLAQRIANLWIDEARLSGNTFRRAKDEYEAVILNWDAKVIDNENESANTLVSGELYLF